MAWGERCRLRWCGIAVLAAALAGPNLQAFSCGRLQRPCEAFSASDSVFVGTVTEVLERRGERIERARMTVEAIDLLR